MPVRVFLVFVSSGEKALIGLLDLQVYFWSVSIFFSFINPFTGEFLLIFMHRKILAYFIQHPFLMGSIGWKIVLMHNFQDSGDSFFLIVQSIKPALNCGRGKIDIVSDV